MKVIDVAQPARYNALTLIANYSIESRIFIDDLPRLLGLSRHFRKQKLQLNMAVPLREPADDIFIGQTHPKSYMNHCLKFILEYSK